MIAFGQYKVTIKNVNEELYLVFSQNEDIITITINYKDVVFSNKINIKEDVLANTDNNNDKGMGIFNIHSFIYYSLENNNTDIEFIYDGECEIVSFEVIFNVKMHNFMFGYHIILNGNYDEFNFKLKMHDIILKTNNILNGDYDGDNLEIPMHSDSINSLS